MPSNKPHTFDSDVISGRTITVKKIAYAKKQGTVGSMVYRKVDYRLEGASEWELGQRLPAGRPVLCPGKDEVGARLSRDEARADIEAIMDAGGYGPQFVADCIYQQIANSSSSSTVKASAMPYGDKLALYIAENFTAEQSAEVVKFVANPASSKKTVETWIKGQTEKDTLPPNAEPIFEYQGKVAEWKWA